jgi:hypothetical protein
MPQGSQPRPDDPETAVIIVQQIASQAEMLPMMNLFQGSLGISS